MPSHEQYESTFIPRAARHRRKKNKRRAGKIFFLSFIMTLVYFTLLLVVLDRMEISLTASNEVFVMSAHEKKELSLSEKAPIPEPVYEIKISKANNTLTVFIDGKAAQTFPVATGRLPSLTPVGTFQIVNKIENPWYIPQNIPGGAPNNPLGHYWLGLNVPGTDGSIYGIHGTNNPSSIGKYVSKGCVRMYNEHVKWLYENVPLYSAVIIE